MKQRIGRYFVLRRLPALDREVYLASDQNRERLIVVVPADADGLIEEEVRRARSIKHRAVVPVLEMFEEDGRRMLVFEHLAGATLTQLGEDLTKRGELLSERSVWHIGFECAAALAAAHALKDGPIVHGHLMPDHVIITWEGGVRVLGLGLSSVMGAQDEGRVEAFCAPEVRAGEPPGPQADAYAIAAIVSWLVMGELPPTDGTIPRINNIGREVPLAVAVGVQRALSSAVDKRIDCRRLASVLQRPARTGQAELAWHMEMLRALRANDPAPSSKAFSRSAKPAPSVDPPPSVAPADSVPAARSRPGKPVSRVALIGHGERAMDPTTEDRLLVETGDILEIASDTEDTADGEPTGEHHSNKGRQPIGEEELRGDELSTEDGEPTGGFTRASHTEDKEPTNPRYLSQPVPAIVSEADDEPTTNYHHRVREDTEVVPPDVLRRETEADAAAVRKQRWQALWRPRTFVVLAALVMLFGVVQWLASSSSTTEDEVAQPAQAVPEKQSPVRSQAPATSAKPTATGSASPDEPLPPDMGHLMVVTDLSVENAGVYVFGDYVGKANERLVVPCGRVFVRLGTRPPRGGPGRRWLSPGHTTQIVCGAVTIVTIEPYPMERAPVATHRAQPPRSTAPPPAPKTGSNWLPDDL